MNRHLHFCIWIVFGTHLPVVLAQDVTQSQTPYQIVHVEFKSDDGYDMHGKLALPQSGKPKAIVLYVQTAEGMTVDMKRPLSRTETFNYFDLYRTKLCPDGIAFFSYEGRGIRMGDALPRFEQIDREVFNTGTLDNKVRDVLCAINALRRQPQCKAAPLLLMGASEGTLLACEAASRAPQSVDALVLYGLLAMNMRENFKYIMSDGAFLVYRSRFDDDDGVITKDEFERDPHKFRARFLQNAPFSVFDLNSDGKFTSDEMPARTKPYLDAVDNDRFDVLQAWASKSAGVSVPDMWFKDHFDHQPMWHFLSKVDVPVGCFHGGMDSNTPVSAVRELEKKAGLAGKTNISFHYFGRLDHTLNIAKYFSDGELPEGHTAIFAFIGKFAGGRDRTKR